jgi:hypothetical protein
MGLAVPVLAQSGNRQATFAAVTVGGILGAVVAEGMLAPQRARVGERGDPARRSGSGREVGRERIGVRFAPEGALMAGLGQRGQHPILSLSF